MGLGSAVQSGFLRIHQAVYEGTRGRIGHRMLGVPSLLMHSTGRKTGKTRTAALMYAKDGDSYVVTASNGGSDKPPGWLYNVKANPSVEIQPGRRTTQGKAEVIEPGHPEYERLWQLVNAKNHQRYNAYQKRTDRKIAMVRLTPER